jgi:RNA polymerase sigma-70 factor (ECF subfamily)
MAQDETRLIAAAKGGDPQAFERAIRPHLAGLFAYARAICGDFHAAEDVVQETAQIAYRKLNFLIPEADFAGWLKAIARRQALSARRKLTKTVLVVDQILESVYEDPAPATVGLRGEALADCLDQLDGRAAQAVKGHYFEGVKLADLADRMGVSGVALRQMLHRVRVLLQDCVRRRLGTTEAPS